MGKSEGRPSWFKVFLHQKSVFDAVPDAVLGQAVKAALHYFATREDMELDALSKVVYSQFKTYIDEAFLDYERDVRNGQKGGRPKKPLVTPGKGGLPSQTQADTDTDADANMDTENKLPARHKYGAYKNVLFTDEEYEKLQAEFPDDYCERIERLGEYMASSGKTYKNHLATLRSWAKKDGRKNSPTPNYGGEENCSL